MSISAEIIMTNRFQRISTAHTLREAMGLILYGEERSTNTGAIVVIDSEGDFAGILTPTYVVRGLCRFAQDVENIDRETFLECIQNRLSEKVDTVMDKELPVLSKTTTFPKAVHFISSGKYECLPVIEDRRVVGLVYATDVFKMAANIALTPEEGGIILDK